MAERRLIVDKSSAISGLSRTLAGSRSASSTPFRRNYIVAHVSVDHPDACYIELFFFQRGNPADLQERKHLFLNNNLAITNDMEVYEAIRSSSD